MTLHRVVLHADMDAFFASVEQRDRPELRGRPVIVGGRSARGVVSSASYEARAFGVRAAMPTGEALRLCPQGVLIPGEMRRYQRESRRIFAIFGRFTPLVEGLSLDEAFLDLTGCERLLGTPRDVAERIRREVHTETGLVVSVGIAPVKLVAKIASDLAKPDGCLEVRAHEVRGFLDPLPVGRLFGIGPVAEQRLVSAGLRTLGDLARADPERLVRRLGPAARRFVALARGDDPRAVEPSREAVSLSEENTFEQDVTDHARISDVILAHADAVARRLRASGLCARTVVLKLKLARRRAAGPRGHPLLTRRTTLDEATDASVVIAREARALLDAADLREAVRLVGVGVTGLAAAGAGEQLGLFEAPRPARRASRLDRALDAIHARFGPESLVRGTRPQAPRAGLSLQHKRGEAEPD